ncbi:MAG: hypothetical protein WC989_06600 [Micavibrio sp.]
MYPTIVKAGSPFEICTSTLIVCTETPEKAIVLIRAAILYG